MDRQLLRVDLTHRRVERQILDQGMVLLGGRALIDALLSSEVDPTAHPLGPSNELIFAPGLLAGTAAPTAGRLSVGAKSPLTGGVKEANVGGQPGLTLARMGLAALIIEGQAAPEESTVLVIEDDSVELTAAPELRGRGNYAVAAALRQKYGQEAVVISVGPAGEFKMAAASVAVTDVEGRPCRHAGRGGLGAVMGAKGLKAVVLIGRDLKPIKGRDPEALKAAVKEYAHVLTASDRASFWRESGTAIMIEISKARGSLPTRNYTAGAYEKTAGINADKLKELIQQRRGRLGHACMSGCVIRCSNVFPGPEGDYLTSGLEYETIVMLGSNLDIDDLDAVAEMDRRCDDYGLDTIEAGAALAVLSETDLFDLGDKKRAVALLDEIGRGTVLGRVLGQGAAVTGRVFGLSRVAAVKGQALPGHAARAIKGLGVTYATSPQGADHTAGFVSAAPLSNQGHAERSREMQISVVVTDSLGLCQFTGLRGEYGLFARLLTPLLGREVSEAEIKKMGQRGLWQEKQFNLAAGLGPGLDRLPEFMSTEPLPPLGTVFDVSVADLDRVFGQYPV